MDLDLCLWLNWMVKGLYCHDHCYVGVIHIPHGHNHVMLLGYKDPTTPVEKVRTFNTHTLTYGWILHKGVVNSRYYALAVSEEDENSVKFFPSASCLVEIRCMRLVSTKFINTQQNDTIIETQKQ